MAMIEQLWIFHCGYVLVPEPTVFKDSSPLSIKKMPLMAAMAFHPEHGPILIDAPFGHEGPHNVGALWGTILRRSVQTFKDEWSIIPRIEQLGVRPSEVHHVLMTHLHFDHTGGMKALGHATFHLEQREWIWANGLSSFDALAAGVAVADFRALYARTELFSLPEYFEREAEGHDIFGDGSITAIALPGHSPGHTGYRIKLADGRTALFLGDAVFQVSHLTKKREPGFFPRLVARDHRMVEYTVGELMRYVEERPDELLICSHDFELGERCMAGPLKL
jgi:N-acyl homoserine lactone hydrolase